VAKKVSRVVMIRDGKTSSEMLAAAGAGFGQNEALGAFGFDSAAREEFAVLDRAGRVQIPQELLEALGVEGNKVRMEMEDGRLVITSGE